VKIVRWLQHTLLARPTGAGQFVVFGLAALMFLAQRFALTRLGLDGAEADLRRAIFYSTTVILIGLALMLRHYLGAWLVAAGIAMNLIPIAAHDGLMPVAWETIRDSGEWPEITEADVGSQVPNSKDIILRREDIRFEALSDRYVVTLPWYGANIYSLGDFFIFAGVIATAGQVVFELVKPPGTKRDDENLAADGGGSAANG
jgi:hypothetical protein